jgi:hypothetical protein
MAVDGPYDDGTTDAEPEVRLDRGGPGADNSAVHPRPTELRTRAEYYETLRAADNGSGQTAENNRDAESGVEHRADPGAERHAWASGWDAVDAEGRPPPDSIHVSSERASHILDGDRWGGGHRHGTGRPEKTEFPAHWDDERIIDRITDVASFPDVQPVLQANQRWRARGERDGVAITVIVHPDGRIWAAWPEEGSPGVIRNPRKGEP